MTMEEKLKEYESKIKAMERELAYVLARLSTLQKMYTDLCRELTMLKKVKR